MRWWSLLVALAAQAVWAQHVVVLEFEGDKAGKLHAQVEGALKKAHQVDLVALTRWKDAAAKKKLKGPQAMTAAAVAKAARSAGVNAAVECTVTADSAAFRILDDKGQELWAKELPVKKGLISDKHAGKLAKAIGAAAAAAPKSEGGSEEEAPEASGQEAAAEETHAPEPKAEESAPPPGMSRAEREKRRQEEEAEANSAMRPLEPRPEERDSDLENEGKKTKGKVGPKLVRLWVAGTTTWRSYCSRPGVTSCAEYDKADPKPPGDPVDFIPAVPYAGFNLALELFPLVALTDSPAQGIGLVANFGMGFSLTKLKVVGTQGETPEKQVISSDRAFNVQAAYRYYFGFGPERDPLVAYAGVRFGVAGRTFEIDPNANVPLPGSARLFPQLGLDGMIPLGSKYAKFVASFTFMISPKPGPDEIQGYGNFDAANGGATGSGIGFELGLTGDIWGPLGYEVRFRYTKFGDQYFGQGTKWTNPCGTMNTCGGAAEESYAALVWGVTASF